MGRKAVKKEELVKVNDVVFLVPSELLQKAFNELLTLPFKQVSPVINELLRLKTVPVKEYSTYEVPVEAPKETEQKGN